MKARIRELIKARGEKAETPFSLDLGGDWPCTIHEAAAKLRIGYTTAYGMFRSEPGVISIGAGRGRRGAIRIPREVFEKVISARQA